MRKKKIGFSVLIIVLIAVFVLKQMYLLFFVFSHETTAIKLRNIEVTSDSVAFEYNALPGYFICSCSYDLDDNGTLTLRFRDTQNSFAYDFLPK